MTAYTSKPATVRIAKPVVCHGLGFLRLVRLDFSTKQGKVGRIGKIKPLFTRRLALVSPRTSPPQPPPHPHDGRAQEATSPARLPQRTMPAASQAAAKTRTNRSASLQPVPHRAPK